MEMPLPLSVSNMQPVSGHPADLSHQLGQLSLQDPAFLQELQRLENQKYQYGAAGQVQLPPAQHDPAAHTGVFPAQLGNMPPMVPMGPNTLPSVPMGGGSTGDNHHVMMSQY